MSTEKNRAAARRFIEQGFNRQDMAEFDRYYDASLQDHALPPNLPSGRDGRKLFISAFFAAFPDIQVRIDDLVAQGDKLVTRWTATGTHRGDLMGIRPTGKTIGVTGIAIDRFEDGRSVEHWEIFNQMGLLQQLGVIPA